MIFRTISAGCLLVASFSLAATTHPDLAQLLAQPPAFDQVRISPDGNFLAVTVFKDDKRQLLCLDRKTQAVVGGVQLADKDEVGEIFWANNQRLVFKIVASTAWERVPKFYGELFGVNCDGSRPQLLFGYRVQENLSRTRAKAMRAWGNIIRRLPDDPKHLLISVTRMNEKGDAAPSIHRMNVETGELKKVGKAPISYSTVLATPQGEPVVAAGVDENMQSHVFVAQPRADDTAELNWQELPELQQVDEIRIERLSADGSGFYFSGRYQADFRGVYFYRLAANTIEAVITPNNADVMETLMSADGDTVIGIRQDYDYPSYQLINSDITDGQILKTLLTKFQGSDVQLTSRSQDGQFWVVRVEADAVAPLYFLYDHSTGKLSPLLQGYPHLKGIKFVQTDAVHFPASDQRQLHGYLTLGAPVQGPQPLVVLVHGGPYGVRDWWEFQPDVQLLAGAGYNVLQVNYRGSKGYGAAHAAAADLHWGDRVQQDIIDGTRWAISQGYGTTGQVCIVGASFGGYSALQASALAPELYQCAVGVAGIYDLTRMRDESDISTNSSFGGSYLDQAIGNDAAQLKAFSPVYRVDAIQADVLLLHGKRDKRAGFAHAELMEQALKQAKKPVRLVEFDDEAHGFYATENQQRYYQLLLEFLAQHLSRNSVEAAAPAH